MCKVNDTLNTDKAYICAQYSLNHAQIHIKKNLDGKPENG